MLLLVILFYSLLKATVLTTSPRPELLAEFWTHLTTEVFSDDESRERLSDRLRDVMLKLLTLIGAPRMLSALIPMAKRQGGNKNEDELDLGR